MFQLYINFESLVGKVCKLLPLADSSSAFLNISRIQIVRELSTGQHRLVHMRRQNTSFGDIYALL